VSTTVEVSKKTLRELSLVCATVKDHFYTDEPYTRSLVDHARLYRISEQLGVPLPRVITAFEEKVHL